MKKQQTITQNSLVSTSQTLDDLSADKVPLDLAKVESLLAQARIPLMPVEDKNEVVTWEDVRDHIIRTIGNTLDLPDLHRGIYGLPPTEKEDLRKAFYKWLLF
ncbi:MAG: hypothetical protein IIT66_00055 [Acetobacter sp.]|nr:hypothetical protein [Acetobacter sp.]MBQ5478592.1 hypothetical protein [Acetobacter sp.]